jgi:hypothetical protein
MSKHMVFKTLFASIVVAVLWLCIAGILLCTQAIVTLVWPSAAPFLTYIWLAVFCLFTGYWLVQRGERQ